MRCGYAGKVLFVDLGNDSIKEAEMPEKTYREFIGGYGLGIRVLYEQMKPRVDPLGRDNILGFVAGSLTGTSVPGSGRYGVVTKSPLTGAWCESNGGGTFGPELKTAGYDGIFFKGAAARPVYLLLRDGKAELKDASALWGKDTYATEDAIHSQTGDNKLKMTIKTENTPKTTLNHPPVDKRQRCKNPLCRLPFFPKTYNQRFHSPECKKSYEKAQRTAMKATFEVLEKETYE